MPDLHAVFAHTADSARFRISPWLGWGEAQDTYSALDYARTDGAGHVINGESTVRYFAVRAQEDEAWKYAPEGTCTPAAAIFAQAAEGMELQPHVTLDVRDDARGLTTGHHHRHVAIAWEGGLIWLDMSKQSDHYCIDVRQFNPTGEMKGQGAFTIVNGARQGFGEAHEQVDGKWTTHKNDALPDTEGRPVTGHGWNGGYNVTLMTDLHGTEAAAIKPSQGNG